MNKIKQNWRLMCDTLRMAYRLSKAAVWTTIGYSLINALKPYVAIFLSAYILDGLVQGEDATKLVIAAAWAVGGTWALGMLEGALQKYNAVHTDIGRYEFDITREKKTLSMDYELLESPAVTDIRNRVKNDRNFGAGFFSVYWQLGWMIRSIVGLIAAVAVLVPLFTVGQSVGGWMAFWMFVGMFGLIVLSTLFQIQYVTRKQHAMMDETANRRSYYSQFVWGWLEYSVGKDIRIYNGSDLFKHHLNEDLVWYKRWYRRMSALDGLFGVVGGVAGGLLQGGAYLFVVLWAVAGAISVGAVLKYASAIYRFSICLADLMNAVSQFLITCRRQQATLDYINISDVLYKGSLPVEKRADYDYEIEFRDVSFKYPGTERYALQNLSMKFKVGQKLAVVGMNGSGKTTMIKLLCRLYDPTEGEILLNGYDIKKYDYDEYMSLFSVVFQDFKIFSFPLGQNVAASHIYDADRVTECLNLAGFGDRLKKMEKGLESALFKDYEPIRESVQISGGEEQKIAIARALYKDAPFVVLDEPTAALDPLAEYDVYSKFDAIIGKKTAVYISHRLSSCRFCDDIIVFHDGRLVQRGSHDELVVDRNGKYYELWDAQAQYYVDTAV